MNKTIFVILTYIFVSIISILWSCSSSQGDNYRSDSASIKAGSISFNEKCAGCHNFTDNGIGPHLAGVTEERSAEWLKSFISDPKKMIDSGDTVANKLMLQFRTIMPSFASMPADEMESLLAFLHTHKKSEIHLAYDDMSSMSNPIPDTIQVSNLVIPVQEVLTVPPSAPRPPRTRIVKMDYQPGSDDLFIVDLRGYLYKIKGDSAELYMDMKKLRKNFIDNPGLATGFGSFAFHPEFQTNGLLYTTHTEPGKAKKADFIYHDSIPVEFQWILTEWKTKNPSAIPFSGESREVMRINVPSRVHGVQEIAFNKTAKKRSSDYGLLYISIGDGGSAEIKKFLVSTKPHNIWGSIIRIDPRGKNGRNGHYGIPVDNPFNNSEDPLAVPEIYAYGFRNPHKITWSKEGEMFAINVGELNIESLNLIRPGGFYGWPVREGTFSIDFLKNKRKVDPLPADDSVFKVTYPVAQFDHDDGTAICGGYEYAGKNVPELKGKYVFGDMASGKLFYVEMKDIELGKQAPIKRWNISYNGKKTTLPELCGTARADMRFGIDHKGELYIFTKQDGKVYMVGSQNAHNSSKLSR